MGDDNDDYEGMNGSQTETQALPPPPPPPPAFGGPSAGADLSQFQFQANNGAQPQQGVPLPANFSTWLNNGNPHQASYAPIGGQHAQAGQPQTNGAQENGAAPNGSASTAPLYNYFTPLDDQDQQPPQQN